MPGPSPQLKGSSKPSQPASPRNTAKVTIQATAIPSMTSMLTLDDELEKKRLQQRADYALHVSRATLLQRRKRWVDAITEYSAALAAVPNDIVALRNRVTCRIEAGLLEEALVDAKKVLAVEEEQHREAQLARGGTAGNISQMQGSALGDRDHRPPYQGLLLLGKVLYAKGEFEEASRIFFRGKSIRPDVEEFHRGAFQCEETLRVTVRPRPPPPAPAPVPRRVHLEDRVSKGDTKGMNPATTGVPSSKSDFHQHPSPRTDEGASVSAKDPAATVALSTFRSCMPEFDNDVKFLADLARSRLFSNKAPNLNNVFSEELYRNLHNHPANDNIQPPRGSRRPQSHSTASRKRGEKPGGLKKGVGAGKDDGKKGTQNSGAKGQHRSMTAGLGWTQDELEKLMYLPQEDEDESGGRSGKGSSRRRRKSASAHGLAVGSSPSRSRADEDSDHSSDAGSAASSPRRMGQKSVSSRSPPRNRSLSVHSNGKQPVSEKAGKGPNGARHTPRHSIASTTASSTTAATSISGNPHQTGPSRSYDAGFRTLMDRIAKDKRDFPQAAKESASKSSAASRVPLVAKARHAAKNELDFSHVKASAEKNAQMEHVVQETLQFLSGRRLFWLHNDPSIKFPEEDAALAAGVKRKLTSSPSAVGSTAGASPTEDAAENSSLLNVREAEVVSRLSRPTSATSIRQSLNAEAIRLAAADREQHRLAAKLNRGGTASTTSHSTVRPDQRTSLAVPVRPLSALSTEAKQELHRILTHVGGERPNVMSASEEGDDGNPIRLGGVAQTPAPANRRASLTFRPTRPTSAPVQRRGGAPSGSNRMFPDTAVTSGEGVTLETHLYRGGKNQPDQRKGINDTQRERGVACDGDSVDSANHRPSASEFDALQNVKQQLQGRLAYEVEVRTGQSHDSSSGVAHGAAFASEGRASTFGLGAAGLSLGISNRAKLGVSQAESSQGKKSHISSLPSATGEVLSAEALGRYLSSQAAQGGAQQPQRMLQLNANDREDDDDDGTASATSSAGRSAVSDSEFSASATNKEPTGAQSPLQGRSEGDSADPTVAASSQLPVSQSKRSLSRKRMMELSKEVESKLSRLAAAAKSGNVPTALSGVRALIARVSETVTSRSDDALLRSELEVKLRLLHSSILLEVQEVQAAAVEASKAIEVAKKAGRKLHSWYLKAIRHTAQIYRHGDEEVLFLSSELDRPREFTQTEFGNDQDPNQHLPQTEWMRMPSAGGTLGNPPLDGTEDTESDLSSLSDAVPNDDSENES